MKRKITILTILFTILLAIHTHIHDGVSNAIVNEDKIEASQTEEEIVLSENEMQLIASELQEIKIPNEEGTIQSENTLSNIAKKNSNEIKEVPQTKYKFQTDNPSYANTINVCKPNNYNLVKGITTFRGNNYRNDPTYGTIAENPTKLTKIWTNNIGQLDGWTGTGWTGQPCIINWDTDTQKIMNLYPEYKEKNNFVEVIYGTLDGNIYFYDLETGKASRPAIRLPSSIKGSVTIDPRGYPLLYVGQGIDQVGGTPVKFGYHIYSLLTGQELLFINGRDKFAYLAWGAFDGNPVIDATTDSIILPGENGILYIVKLNTTFDKTIPSIAIDPIITKYRYTNNGYAAGMENSIVVHKNYGYFTNNRGLLQCIDLNKLTPVWTQQLEDDCDATIGAEEENGTLLLYTGCEIDRRKKEAPSIVKKINGYTGEILWEYSCTCKYDANVNGGLLSSPIIGKNELSNYVIFNFSKTTSLKTGKMVCLNKADGKMVWEKDLQAYSWSSPVAIYADSGKGYIILCDSLGIVHLIDGLTGDTISTLQTGGGNFESSPAIYENHIVIGSRGKRIYRIDILPEI